MIPIPPGEVGDLLIEKYFTVEEWEKELNTNQTSTHKAIGDYTGISFPEISQLPYALFMLYRHDAWVSNMNQSEKGREFMKACWRLQQTKADTEAIRKFNERGR